MPRLMCRTVNYRQVFLHCSNVHGKAIAKRFPVVLFIWAYLTSCIVVLHSLNVSEPVFTVVNIQCADRFLTGKETKVNLQHMHSGRTSQRTDYASIMTTSR